MDGGDKNGDRQINHALSLWLSVRLLKRRLQPPPPPPRGIIRAHARVRTLRVRRGELVKARKRRPADRGEERREGRKEESWLKGLGRRTERAKIDEDC